MVRESRAGVRNSRRRKDRPYSRRASRTRRRTREGRPAAPVPRTRPRLAWTRQQNAPTGELRRPRVIHARRRASGMPGGCAPKTKSAGTETGCGRVPDWRRRRMGSRYGDSDPGRAAGGRIPLLTRPKETSADRAKNVGGSGMRFPRRPRQEAPAGRVAS